MIGDSSIIQVANAVVLPAAGAFTGATAMRFRVQGASQCAFWVTYTPGAAGGTPTVSVNWLPNGTTNVPVVPGDHIGVVISSGLTLVAEQWILANPGGAGGVAAYNRVLNLIVPPGSIFADFQIAESGVVGSPGTVNVWAATRAGS